MKRCPECRRDYYDDSLHYCLDDGTALLEGPASGDETATAILRDVGLTRGSTVGSQTKFVYVAPVPVPKLSQITFSESIEQYPAWSADGKELAFSREEAGIRSIFVKDLSSGDERRITSGTFDDIHAS